MNHRRYSRQTNLPEIGLKGQKALAKASVLCVGAGGLGSPALLYLAAAGVGHIGIAEFDSVDETNLQRQILFNMDQIGQPKAWAAKSVLNRLNADISIKVHEQGLNAENAEEICSAYDVIIDGSDNFSTKYLINDVTVKLKKPFIYGAIQRFDGQASVFDSTRGPCYRCLHPDSPQAKIQNCAESGVIGTVAGLVGTTQAMQAIQIIVNDPSFEPLIGRLWMIDTKTMESRILKIPKNPDCTVCSQKSHNIKLSYQPPACALSIRSIWAKDYAPQDNVCLIDVRERHEWNAGFIEGAEHFALSRLMNGERPIIEDNKSITLYCQHGVRSLQAAQILLSIGHKSVSHIQDGYAGWEDL